MEDSRAGRVTQHEWSTHVGTVLYKIPYKRFRWIGGWIGLDRVGSGGIISGWIGWYCIRIRVGSVWDPGSGWDA
eukprot:621463-Prorocentrum_minimum.AAC.3